MGTLRFYLIQVRSEIYVYNFRSKFSLTKTLQKDALFVKVLQNDKMHVYNNRCIRVSSKLFRKFKLNVAEQQGKIIKEEAELSYCAR